MALLSCRELRQLFDPLGHCLGGEKPERVGISYQNRRHQLDGGSLAEPGAGEALRKT